MILFLTFLKFCLVFYGIYLENFWRSFCARVGFHVSARFRDCRRFRKRWRSRELRRARLRLLRTRQECLNLWYDRCFACLRESLCVAYECPWVPRCLWGNYPHVPKLQWSLVRDGLIMWWHEGQQGGTVVAYQPCVIRQIPTLTWTESRYRSFHFRTTTCFFCQDAV